VYIFKRVQNFTLSISTKNFHLQIIIILSVLIVRFYNKYINIL